MTVAIAMPDGQNEPIYEVGDRVVIFNPFANDGLIFDEVDAPKHATIKRVAYVSHLGIFAYQLEEYVGWYNESWLHFDEYLPMLIDVEKAKEAERKERAEAIDNLLDIASWNRKMLDKTGEEAYGDALMAVEAELKKLTETDVEK